MRCPRIALLAAAALAASACAGTEVPSHPMTTSSAASTPATAGAPAPSSTVASCSAMAASLTSEQKVGQLFMVAVTGEVLDPDLRATMTRLGIGSAFYLGDDTPRGVASTAVVSAQLLNAGGELPVLVAVDQEGGLVQRLNGPGFDDIPAASEQAAQGPATLAESWTRWGQQLRSAGVHMDLAPVADVVPDDRAAANDPVAKLQRGYGSDGQTVGRLAASVVTGLDRAKVASSAKHFPGLGRVTTNTDEGEAHDDSTTADDLASFRAVIDAGVDSVMVSSAVYEKLDPKNRAVFSRAVITDLLRGRLGWQGVVISDDLGAAAAVGDLPPGQRAVDFLAAGGDLVVNADAGSIDEMVEAVAQRAADDQAFAKALDEHVARVLALKASVGLVDCSA